MRTAGIQRWTSLPPGAARLTESAYIEAFHNRQRQHSTLGIRSQPTTNNDDSRR